MDANLPAYFMPHGLGHLIGLETHDVGGIRKQEMPRPKELGYKSLRCLRKLEKDMVITVEPGCYFVGTLLDRVLANEELAKLVDVATLETFRDFGGVRLEDCVVVTSSGIRNLTCAPRTIADVEAVMAGIITTRAELEHRYCAEAARVPLKKM